ncbi:MAG: hypothetical protein DWQ30_23920 [Acidobacteria bacterium]|nr:MAG: hypothetical protein DWQ30_23920 [Acidobacteriota bacterium]
MVNRCREQCPRRLPERRLAVVGEQGWMLMTALFMLLIATLVIGLFATLAAAGARSVRFEIDAVRLEALRDAALAHGLGLASSGAVGPGESVDFSVDIGDAKLSGTVSEITSRPRPGGEGVYLIDGEVRAGPHRRAARVRLNTVRSPPEVSGWSPRQPW